MQLPLFSCAATETSSACVTLAEVQQRPAEVPLVMADGLGVNSIALLIQLSRSGIRPDLILFADTGSEKPEPTPTSSSGANGCSASDFRT